MHIQAIQNPKQWAAYPHVYKMQLWEQHETQAVHMLYNVNIIWTNICAMHIKQCIWNVENIY